MLDHISLGSANYPQALAFYDAILKPLGYTRVFDAGDAMGYGSEGVAAFWVGNEKNVQPSTGLHVAFQAPSQQAVNAFHQAALANGGKDNGAPGLRPHYSPTYYAAFVISPEGHHLEAVHGRHFPLPENPIIR